MRYWKVKIKGGGYIQRLREQTHGIVRTEYGGDNMENRYNGQRLKVDGHDDAIIGMGNSFGRHHVLVYDSEKIIQKLMKRDKMTYEEAEEFFDYNIVGSYNGPGMPIFVYEYVEI
jgi:hypothetical protein